jgi:hypothetical protein
MAGGHDTRRVFLEEVGVQGSTQQCTLLHTSYVAATHLLEFGAVQGDAHKAAQEAGAHGGTQQCTQHCGSSAASAQCQCTQLRTLLRTLQAVCVAVLAVCATVHFTVHAATHLLEFGAAQASRCIHVRHRLLCPWAPLGNEAGPAARRVKSSLLRTNAAAQRSVAVRPCQPRRGAYLALAARRASCALRSAWRSRFSASARSCVCVCACVHVHVCVCVCVCVCV